MARGGALGELDAVGWVIRLAKRLEARHARHGPHGAVSLECVVVERARRSARAALVDARLCPKLAGYHSPERGEGGVASEADDAWALGVTLYALLTGTLPFPDASRAANPTPLEAFGIADAELQGAVDFALEPDAARRAAGVAALRERLQVWRPAARLGQLRAIDEPTAADLLDEPADDERTAVKLDAKHLRAHIDAVLAKTRPEPAKPPPSQPGPPDVPTIEETDALVDAAQPPSEAPKEPRAASIVASQQGAAPRSRFFWFVIAAAVASLGTAGVLLWPRLRAPPALAPQPANASAGAVSSTTSASAPHEAATASPTATASAAPVADVSACVREVLPSDSFEEGSRIEFQFLCSETDPRRGSAAFKKRIVLGGAKRRVTNAMREWSMLGWYEMPAFAVTRAACCPGAAPAELPSFPGTSCEQFADVLDDLGRAAVGDGAGPLEDALERYRRAVYCAFRSGSATLFGPPRPPMGGEDTTFRKTLERVRARSSR